MHDANLRTNDVITFRQNETLGDIMSNFQFESLDRTTRRHMRAEFYLDLTESRVHLSERLNASGRLMFPVALESAIERGDDASLAESLREGGFIREWEESHTRGGKAVPKHVPWNAADTIAEEAFNRYFMRGIARRALEEGVNRVEVYRAKEVSKPRSESDAKLGAIVDARRLLEDLRAHPGDKPELGIPPGPNSGLSVRLPAGAPAVPSFAGARAELNSEQRSEPASGADSSST